MSLANALKKAASASLKKLGGDVTIRQVTTGSYNTTTGAISESTSDTTIKGALSGVSRNQVNDLIESQDKLLTISAGFTSLIEYAKDFKNPIIPPIGTPLSLSIPFTANTLR